MEHRFLGKKSIRTVIFIIYIAAKHNDSFNVSESNCFLIIESQQVLFLVHFFIFKSYCDAYVKIAFNLLFTVNSFK